MELTKNQAIKTLRDGASWHRGAHKWSLPTLQPDGTYAAGEWTPTVAPSICEKGWHLTTQPALWWSHEGNVAAYLAEYDGATSAREGEDKIAVERCRLLRPLTKSELESCGIFIDGEHVVKTGTAYAYGSATVTAYGSATVTAYGSATVTAYGSATVTAYGSATVTAYGSATVRAYGSATVRASGSATAYAYDSATVRAYDSATVRAYDSATVRAYDSAKTHTAGSAVCTAWNGTTLVLTRDGNGVIIDRRGAAPKTYVKRAGLDGWRYADGVWSQRKAKAAT